MVLTPELHRDESGSAECRPIDRGVGGRVCVPPSISPVFSLGDSPHTQARRERHGRMQNARMPGTNTCPLRTVSSFVCLVHKVPVASPRERATRSMLSWAALSRNFLVAYSFTVRLLRNSVRMCAAKSSVVWNSNTQGATCGSASSALRKQNLNRTGKGHAQGKRKLWSPL